MTLIFGRIICHFSTQRWLKSSVTDLSACNAHLSEEVCVLDDDLLLGVVVVAQDEVGLVALPLHVGQLSLQEESHQLRLYSPYFGSN